MELKKILLLLALLSVLIGSVFAQDDALAEPEQQNIWSKIKGFFSRIGSWFGGDNGSQLTGKAVDERIIKQQEDIPEREADEYTSEIPLTRDSAEIFIEDKVEDDNLDPADNPDPVGLSAEDTDDRIEESANEEDEAKEIEKQHPTHIIRLTNCSFPVSELNISAGDMVIWENARDGLPIPTTMIIGTNDCAEIKSGIFSPGENFSWIFDSKKEWCIIADGIYTTQAMRISFR